MSAQAISLGTQPATGNGVPTGRHEYEPQTNQETTKRAADFPGLIRQIRAIRG